MRKYYIVLDNISQGPFSIEELGKKNITNDTLVWYETLTNWTKAVDVDELKYLIKLTPPQIPTKNKTPIIVEANIIKSNHKLINPAIELIIAKEIKTNFKFFLYALIFGIISYPFYFFKNDGFDNFRMYHRWRNYEGYSTFYFTFKKESFDELKNDSEKLGYNKTRMIDFVFSNAYENFKRHHLFYVNNFFQENQNATIADINAFFLKIKKPLYESYLFKKKSFTSYYLSKNPGAKKEEIDIKFDFEYKYNRNRPYPETETEFMNDLLGLPSRFYWFELSCIDDVLEFIKANPSTTKTEIYKNFEENRYKYYSLLEYSIRESYYKNPRKKFDTYNVEDYHEEKYKKKAQKAISPTILTAIFASLILMIGRYIIKGVKWVDYTSKKSN